MRDEALTRGVRSLLVVVLGVACVTVGAVTARGAGPVPVTVPAAAGSGMYSLTTTPDGEALLSWIEPEAAGHALKLSRFTGSAWAAPQVVARGEGWFVNWADKPAVVALPGGELFAHWLVNTPGDHGSGHAYGLKVARSADGGRSWRPVMESGTTNTADYTGFMGFVPADGGVLAAYLAPLAAAAEQTSHEGHVKTLRLARFSKAGATVADERLDADVCTCCPLALAMTSGGPIVAYRDHREGERRDISIVRRVAGRWSEPASVHDDGWRIAGCPVNGPSLAAAASRVAITWFTAAGDTPRVRLAFSDDAAATFAAPVTVDDGSPVGWPSAVLVDDGAIVSWLERKTGENGIGEVRLRHVSRNGTRSAAVTVTTTSSGRPTGMPQLARIGDQLLVAWRADDRVQSALVPMASVRAATTTAR